MTIEDIRRALQDRRLGMVSEATGIHYNTLKSIRDGKTTDPKASTARILSQYLQGGRDDKPV